jgi:hypothetical protein
LYTTVSQFVHHRQPELRTLGLRHYNKSSLLSKSHNIFDWQQARPIRWDDAIVMLFYLVTPTHLYA